MESDVPIVARFLNQGVMDKGDVLEGGVRQVFSLVPTHQIGLAGFYFVCQFKGKIQLPCSRIECSVFRVELANDGILQRRILNVTAQDVEG